MMAMMRRMRAFAAMATPLSFVLQLAAASAAAPIPVDIAVDTTAAPTPFPHFWKTTFGSGHARLTLRADWQLHLKQARDELGLGGVRYHGIFDDDMGVVTGHRQYNWTLIDARCARAAAAATPPPPARRLPHALTPRSSRRAAGIIRSALA